ncbi:hypothetical protein LTR64_005367 [Lithohypha guttulata]|uniref:uncharacterized protein n=1 Tax=Lithohypha guttulata TaxID=1690604 RepID=UPI002DDF2C5E|nr:hypothetical protein LTR51_002838 [Lithohypha guttulata]
MANGQSSAPSGDSHVHTRNKTNPLLKPCTNAPAVEQASSRLCEDDTLESLLDHEPHSLTSTSTWKAESWLLLSYALPLIGTYLLQYFYSVVTIFVAGHIDSDALAAASIGVTTMTIIGYAIFEGMATALDTLCAQAFGLGNLTGVGLHVQKMMLLMVIVGIPIGAFWLSSPWVLALFVKQERLAHMAGRFLQISLIGLPGYASFEALKRFVQAQGEFNSSLVVLVVCAPVNIFLNWLFCFKLDWGLGGTALAAALTNNLRPILLVATIFTWNRWTLQCWGGFSRNVFTRWGPMIQLSTAGSVLNLAEWFAFEVLTFSSSYISTKHIAAQTILTTCSVLVWHIPFSVSVAVTTRVGHLIGAGSLKTAKRVIIFYGVLFICIGIFDGILLFCLRHIIPKFFSDDAEVQAIAARTMPFVALFQLIDAIIAGCSGVLRGFGRQAICAWVAFPVNYLGAVPLALWLELGSPNLQLVGCWTALQGGMVVIAVVELAALKIMNWERCVEDARLRI